MTFPMPPVSTPDLAWLHQRLTIDAEAAGLLDVAYRILDTPVGPLLLAATEAGLVRVAYVADSLDDVLDELATRISLGSSKPRHASTPRQLSSTSTSRVLGRRSICLSISGSRPGSVAT